MGTPIRVTADTLGVTVFHTRPATLEWTPDGRIRIVQTLPGEAPVVLLDTPPSGLAQVNEHTVNRAMLVFRPREGKKVMVSLERSMLAPEPHESADAYARRHAATGVPPQSWWAQSLAASGVKVVHWGWLRTMAVGFAGAIGILVVCLLLLAGLAGAF